MQKSIKPKSIKPTELQNQIIIYSKNWYKRSDNILDDIRYLMGKYSGTELEYISDRDAMCVIIETFETFVADYDRIDALKNMLGMTWGGCFKDFKYKPEEYMIGKLATIDGKYVDMSEKYEIDFRVKG